jgi:hypothetical protein
MSDSSLITLLLKGKQRFVCVRNIWVARWHCRRFRQASLLICGTAMLVAIVRGSFCGLLPAVESPAALQEFSV